MGILSSSIWVLYQGRFFLAATERKNITNLFCFERSHYIVFIFSMAYGNLATSLKRLESELRKYHKTVWIPWLALGLHWWEVTAVATLPFELVPSSITGISERLSEKICTRQSQKVIRISTIHCSWHCSRRTYFCCFFSALTNICPWPLVSFFQTSLMSSEFKATHNTFRDCHVHFLRQPFSKQLYTTGRTLQKIKCAVIIWYSVSLSMIAPDFINKL